MPIYRAGTALWDSHSPKAPDIVLMILLQHSKPVRAPSVEKHADSVMVSAYLFFWGRADLFQINLLLSVNK